MAIQSRRARTASKNAKKSHRNRDDATNLYFRVVVKRRRRLYVDQKHRGNGASKLSSIISAQRLDAKRLAADWRLTPDSARVIGRRQGAPLLRAPADQLQAAQNRPRARPRLCPALRGLATQGWIMFSAQPRLFRVTPFVSLHITCINHRTNTGNNHRVSYPEQDSAQPQ